MANIMSQKNVRNKVHRNGFDLSFRNSFTAKVGELLPVFCKEVIPGDTFDIDVSSFTRTQPVNSAAFSRLREYYDFYFVPYSLLWDKFESFIVQTNQPFHAKNYRQGADVSNQPYISTRNLFDYLLALRSVSVQDNTTIMTRPGYFNEVGFQRYTGTLKLLQYLGYGDWVSTMASTGNIGTYEPADVMLNPFPLMAYQKIYQDYFRNSQWEKPAPWCYNVDYLMDYSSHPTYFNLLNNPEQFINAFFGVAELDNESKFNMFDLRYANYKKDLFTGVLPSPQFGDTAIAAPITGTLTGLASYLIDPDGSLAPGKGDTVSFNGNPLSNLVGTSASGGSSSNVPYLKLDIDFANNLGASLGKIPVQTAGVSVFALRQAEFLQKWREITQSGSLDYKEQIEKHWGVKVSPYQSYMCRWLGGSSGNITINEIVNQNLDTVDSTANLFGKAAGSVGGKKIHFHSDGEYGIIMGIYHCEPVLDWAHIGLDRLNTKTDAGAYAIPEFDSLGMEALPATDLCFTDGKVHAYQPSGVGDPIIYNFGYLQNVEKLPPMSHWVSPLTYEDIIFKYFFDGKTVTGVQSPDFDALNYASFKISPSVVDSIFAVNADDSIDTDCLLIGAFFDCKAVRNLSTDGLPY